MTFILTLNIFIRFVPLMSMHWFDEILELLYGALVFYGAAAVWVAHGHFSVGDWISKLLPNKRARFVYRFLVEGRFAGVHRDLLQVRVRSVPAHRGSDHRVSRCRRNGCTPACRFPA